MILDLTAPALFFAEGSPSAVWFLVDLFDRLSSPGKISPPFLQLRPRLLTRRLASQFSPYGMRPRSGLAFFLITPLLKDFLLIAL